MKTRILLVDDHRVFRQGLCRLLADEADLEVVGQADDGRAALELARELLPHVVVMDISMPGLNGIDAARTLRGIPEGPQVVLLSMHADRRFVTDALQAGVTGYVLKESAFEELAHAIRTVRDRGVYLTPKIAGVVAEDYRAGNTTTPSPTAPVLSPREREVLQLIAEGHTTKGIAKTLNLSTKTVEAHRRRIMERLQIDSLAALIKWAVRAGLTQIEN